jgi:hypothetical protein
MLLDRTRELGLPPHRIGIHGPGLRGKYQAFERMSKRLNATDFSEIRAIELCNLRPDWKSEIDDWVWSAGIGRSRSHTKDDHGHWRAHWEIVPSVAHLDYDQCIDQLLAFATIVVQRYGFVFDLASVRGFGLSFLAMGAGYAEADANLKDETDNTGFWGVQARELADKMILRGVYRLNLLSRPYLELPVEGTTLERWIKKDDARGTLEPLVGNEKITLWTPAAENIPRIRESLFRAGILYYWRHFYPGDPQERDFSRRFVPAEPIPEIFRADYRHATDPPLDP